MSDVRDTEPRLLKEPRGGVPDVTSTLDGYHRVCDAMAEATGSLAADAERASGFRYGHEDWLIQFKREGAGIALLDPVALTRAGADWNEFNDAVGDATWILHDSLMDLPGFAEIGLKPKALFDTEIAARLLGLHRFGLAAVTEHYLGITLAKEHSAADWSYRPLPRDWRNYAALDVEVLIELETMMRRDLKAAGKDEWAAEEFSHALVAGLAPRKPHPIPWLRISRITQLSRDPRGLAIAKSLWEERDRLARQYDIAPSSVIGRFINHRGGDQQAAQCCPIPRAPIPERACAHPYRHRAGQNVRAVRADSACGQTEGLEAGHRSSHSPEAHPMAYHARPRTGRKRCGERAPIHAAVATAPSGAL